MRRHAKAPTAGSTQRQDGRLGRFFRGARTAPALATLLGSVAFLFASAAPAAAAGCANEIRREEQGVAALRLPDCRAYEDASPGSQPKVSPSGGVAFAPDPARASISGDAVAYKSNYPAEGAENSGKWYLARRGPDGWAAATVVPQETTETAYSFACEQSVFYTPDLSKNVIEEGARIYSHQSSFPEGYCGANEEVLDPRETEGYRNLFLHEIPDGLDASGGAYQLVSLNEAESAPGNSRFVAGSSDLSTIVFESEGQLTPEALGVTPGIEGGFNTYVWANGAVRLATVLPDGSPVQAELASPVQAELAHGAGNKPEYSHAVAADGSRLFFEYGGAIYMRVNPSQPQSAISGGECTESQMACTVQVDESQGPGSSGGAHFELANAEGTKVFFTSDQKMTSDSTAVAGKEDLYEYDTESRSLTDLTVNASEPADVWAISDTSADGSYLYFVAEAALEGSGAPAPGDCRLGEAGDFCNLYVLHEGATSYIASVSFSDGGDFKAGRALSFEPLQHHYFSSNVTAESSPSGRFFAFQTTESIEGEGPGIYLYDSADQELNCVSCGGGGFIEPEVGGSGGATWRRRQVLDNGAVLFTTSQGLVAADTNGEPDVYKYENGERQLISSGSALGASGFVDASPSGNDIFFVTSADIVSSDTDGATTLYDARAGGGFPEPPPLPGCEGEACRGAGTGAPPGGGAGTAAFQGPGNATHRHKRDCGSSAKRAQRLSRLARRLRRQAERSDSAEQARRLRQRSAELARQSGQISKNAKRCRRTNRGAGK